LILGKDFFLCPKCGLISRNPAKKRIDYISGVLTNPRLQKWEKMMIDSAVCEQMISSIKVATLIKNSDNQNIFMSSSCLQ
jgi:hypothetical protein